MAITYIEQTLSAAAQETLGMRVDKHMPELDPLWKAIVTSSDGVKATDDTGALGEGFVWRGIFRTGMAGQVKPDSLQQAAPTGGDGGSDGDADRLFNMTGGYATWPQQPTLPAYSNWTVSLKFLRGTMDVPGALLRASELTQGRVDQIEAILEGTAENLAFFKCSNFWADTDNTSSSSGYPLHGILAKFTGTNVNVSNGAFSASYVITTDTINRLTDGQAIDLWRLDAASDEWCLVNVGSGGTHDPATPANQAFGNGNNALFINSVDGFANKIEIYNASGATLDLDAVEYCILPHGAYGTLPLIDSTTDGDSILLPHNPARLIRSSGTIYGNTNAISSRWQRGIVLADHPVFRSYEQAINGSLTQAVLFRELATCERRRRSKYRPDTFIASPGVWASYADSLDGAITYERNGTPLKLRDGVQSEGDSFMQFQLFGRKYRGQHNNWIEEGTMYGINMGEGNYRELRPKLQRNAGTNSYFDPSIQFVAPSYGNASIFHQKISSSNYADAAEAQFIHTYELLSDVIGGMKLTGLSNSYSSAMTAL